MKNSAAKYLLMVFVPAMTLVMAASLARGTPKAPATYFLVAQPDLPDPMFRESVVLMLPPTGTPLIIGLIVNKPTKMKLNDLFSSTAAFSKRSDPAYFGGPVDIGTPLVVSNSAHAPSGATLLFNDVYLSVDPQEILSLFKSSRNPAPCGFTWGGPNGRTSNFTPKCLKTHGITCHRILRSSSAPTRRRSGEL